MPSETPGAADASAARIGRGDVWFANEISQTALYDRDRLQPGHRLTGPAVIFQYDTTSLIPPGWVGWVDGQRNLLLRRAAMSFSK